MSTWLSQLDSDGSIPIHVQIRRKIQSAVTTGELVMGQKLPSVRDMARVWGVNRLTVLKSIKSLTRAGLLAPVQGKGVYISGKAAQLVSQQKQPTNVFGSFFEGLAEGPEPHQPNPHSIADNIKDTVQDSFLENCISFSVGFPPNESIPQKAIRACTNRLLRSTHQPGILGYSPTDGLPELHEQITRILETRGLALTPQDKILVTSGAQHAINLCLSGLIRSGQSIAVESPGYLGIISACRLNNIPMSPVPVDKYGLNPERLEHTLRKNEIGAIYTVANFQNPTGVCQSLSRRKQILDLAARYNTYIIEDDTYADLRFGGRNIAPIKSLPGSERVIYIGSFSKSLAPGFRLGFLSASSPLVELFRHYKEIADISTGSLVQAIVADLIRSGFYARHLARMRKLYRQRRDVMLEALLTCFPDWVQYTRPKGGLHIWVLFNRPVQTRRLLERCRSYGVSFAPGHLFFFDGRNSSSLRLNFSSHPPDRIFKGMRRLAACLNKEINP